MRLAPVVFVPVVLTSCALASAPERRLDAEPIVEAAASAESAAEIVAPPADEPAGAADILVPTGRFDSIEALCAAQKKLAAPRIADALRELADRGETDVYLEPRCERSKAALAATPLQLEAPFLEAAAIEVEAGHSTRTHVVARTKDGWYAAPEAAIDVFHEDPGCFSIERDAGILAIRVERGSLVIVNATSRGAEMEEPEVVDDEQSEAPVSWDDVTHYGRACRLGAAGLACGEPVVLRVERVPSTDEAGRIPSVIFETTSSVDANGNLVPKARYAA